MDLNTINSMSYEQFLDTFGNIIERCPLVTAAIWSQQPFASVTELENRVFDFIESLPLAGKEGILRCHPDLAGRDLMRGTLTDESQNEQAQAGLTLLSAKEKETLGFLNLQYKAKFGFPFVICAKMSDKNKIMQELGSRLQNEQSEELQKGIAEVKKICHLRICDLFLNEKLPTKL
ncbi:2-oxo-4-hydroxy-4-carboxy-5-ureidoimidazoline decarboxylase [Xenopus laevis]|uniref:2-oxo-4-hydroxy-4-carboxy-5-ureidoimidazoline decarboxylase n=2 Tax=Xenopus laevis TaxID=8355 RepID=URAD_XENLA|nr:2-oxo-4-hydroxy-4-carboxy-5-ureidoimidazoline decarboxylase [Xenopus laevis]A1L1C5.1 RecName: Full=2-oxo-4-hydroxy-4-carboxy-5-ureidoimidazoline decarboxylase; Short=OHCU decarboxylase; AltName: Full=Parahox neighbor; AltName: Full=Ureidoimidazoline (2-oxo-4-hydroxy-4-carboxy-5-) decarboxylase [Xenopus laevis]AAI28986.1 LOC100037066 protein [Xenopus laevis]OCT96069.1 hypothetical protein XELAEV_18013751mg [Xenopus laevis]